MGDLDTMTDIVERLRAPKEAVRYIEAQVPFTCSVLSSDNVATMAEAADEIERLRRALLQMTAIIETQSDPDIDALHDVARAALSKGK